MSSGVFIKLCSKEYRIGSEESEPKSKFSKCISKNHDIIFIVIAAIFATFAILIAYNYIPVLDSTHHMFSAGCLATLAQFAFIWGVLRVFATRGCIIVRKNHKLEQV